jgi:cytochrome P450
MDVDFNSPALIADPWPVLKQIRELGAVVWNRRGHWMTARDQICRQILNAPATFTNQGTMAAIFGEEAFIAIDDRAKHNALRNVWMPAFRHESVAALTPIVREMTGRMLDAVEADLREGRAVDLTAALCAPLPPSVTAHMLGMPRDMLGPILKWSDDIGNAASSGWPIDFDHDPAWLAGEQAKRELAEYIFEQIRYRRAHPGGGDLISQLVHSPVGRTMSDEGLMVNVRQLLFGGSETTQKWLAHIVVSLGMSPETRAELLRDRKLVSSAAEEIMRFETVVQSDPRTIRGDNVSIEGVPLADGQEMILLFGGANRDPERYVEPDRMDIRRAQKSHLGFGFGLHSCLGVTVARLEAAVAADMLLERFPNYVLDGVPAFAGFNLRGPSPVRVRLP